MVIFIVMCILPQLKIEKEEKEVHKKIERKEREEKRKKGRFALGHLEVD